MTNSMWVVTMLYFLLANLINHVSSGHNQQNVGDTTLFLPRQFHQSCIFPSPTGSEWHCFISLPGSLINHVSSHDQQYVSDTALFFARQSLSHQSCIPWPTVCEWHCFIFCQAVSSIMSHNREWVTLLYLINYVSPHDDQQTVSDTALFLVSSIVFHPMTNRKWVALLYFINYASPITDGEWQCFVSY